MKLLTLNCHSWQEDHQIEKIKTLARVIHANSYDVIALQEVSQSIDKPAADSLIKEDNYVHILIQELNRLDNDSYSYVWGLSHIGYDIYEEGSALLTKHPILASHSFYVTNDNDPTNWKVRRIVGATLSIDGKETDFFSCHLGWWEDQEEPFKQQVDKILQHTSKERDFFLMGDFNNDARVTGEGYDYLLSKQLHDTYQLAKRKDEGTTVRGHIAGWDENIKDLRIDLILASREQNVDSSYVIFNGEREPVISDHFGVEVTL
ncbi:MAG: endonuclease/exonuclease/phosphatase family protein [Bacillus sp. (in: firmicutes)]